MTITLNDQLGTWWVDEIMSLCNVMLMKWWVSCWWNDELTEWPSISKWQIGRMTAALVSKYDSH